ncbi:MAG: TIR domain-containing protein [Pseudomonadota bacterium]
MTARPLIFISYNRSDPRWHYVENIAKQLGKNGFDVFRDEEGLREASHVKIGDTIQNALEKSIFVLVCVGQKGLGAYQCDELKLLYEMSHDHETPEIGKPQPLLLRLSVDSHEELEEILDAHARGEVEGRYLPGKVREWLGDRLSYVHYPLPKQQPLGAAIKYIQDQASGVLEVPSSKKENTATDTHAEELAKAVRKDGVTIFVGPVWPDRVKQSVLNPLRFAEDVVKACELPEHIQMSPERAVTLHHIAVRQGNSMGSRSAELALIERVRKASRPPSAYSKIANYVDLLSQDKARRRNPIIMVTSNTDVLLERTLVQKGITFLRITPISDGTYRQTLFSVRRDQDGEIELRRGSIRLKAAKESAYAAYERALEQGIDRDEPLKTRPWNDDTEHDFYGGKLDDEDVGRFRSLSEGYVDDETQSQIWHMAEIDRLIETHVREAALEVTDKKSETGRLELKVNEELQRACLECGIPIVVKLLGCVSDRRIERMLLPRLAEIAQSEKWIPTTIASAISRTAVLFVGYSLMNPTFLQVFPSTASKCFNNKQGLRYFLSPMRSVSNRGEAASTEYKGDPDFYDTVDGRIEDLLTDGTELQELFPQLTIIGRRNIEEFFGNLQNGP